MDEFMRSIFGSAWAYYVAFGILFAWWLIYRIGRK
jgi:hypothetical protein